MTRPATGTGTDAGDGSRDGVDRVLVARLDAQLALGHDDFLIV